MKVKELLPFIDGKFIVYTATTDYYYDHDINGNIEIHSIRCVGGKPISDFENLDIIALTPRPMWKHSSDSEFVLAIKV